MAVVPSFDDASLQALCDILGATDTGLTGSEIGHYLFKCHFLDPDPTITKRHRLFGALSLQQKTDVNANGVLKFLTTVMTPVRYVANPAIFERERTKLNEVLAFKGIALGEDGALRKVETVRTLGAAQSRASALRKALGDRQVHPDVLRFCRAELLADNYFHAVFEATKSVADKLRTKTGLTTDGAPLVDQALAVGKQGHPRLAFNSLQTESERSEQTGLLNLIKGVFGAFRNTTGHAPRIHWQVTEQDALDILTTLSLIHRRLDAAVRTHVP
jgi:uncharacterized protein (TIGR02391 family)